MRAKLTVIITSIACFVTVTSMLCYQYPTPNIDIETLRNLYSSGNKATWPKPLLDSSVVTKFIDIGNLDSMKYPFENPFSAAKKELGKILFFDPRLSQSGQVACASCHDSQLGWADGKQLSFGHNRQLGTRNAMSLFNVGYYKEFFWDGRATSIEHQVQFPTADAVEMAQPLAGLDKKIKKIKGYTPYFAKAFGNNDITNDKIFKAIATFERSIVSPKSRFDFFITGKKDALTDDELMGLHLYRTKANCINCHNGGLFSDNKLHNDGQTLFATQYEDLGQYNITHNRADVGKFKTPSLRETASTGPWMHHGNFPSLKDVVEFYNLGNPTPLPKKYKGERDSILPVKSPILRKLNLSAKEMEQIVAFLQSITAPVQSVRIKPVTAFPQ